MKRSRCKLDVTVPRAATLAAALSAALIVTAHAQTNGRPSTFDGGLPPGEDSTGPRVPKPSPNPPQPNPQE